MVGLAGDLEAVAAVRPDPARDARPHAPGRRGHDPARRGAPRSTRCARSPTRAGDPRPRGPPPPSPPREVRRPGRAGRGPATRRSPRWPAATPGRPARTATPPPRRTPTPRSAAPAGSPRSRSRSTAASADTTPSGPSYAPPSSTESRCDPVTTPRPGRRGVPPRDRRCRSGPLEPQPAGVGLLGEPGGELALGGGERLAEVAAGGRRPADRRQVGPHLLEVVRHTRLHGVPGRRTPPPHDPRLRRHPGRPGRSSTGRSPTPSAHRAPASARAGRSWCSTSATTSTASGRSPRPRASSRTAGCGDADRAGGDHPVLQQGGLPRAATPRRTRAGPTRTRPAGRCRSGTWTPPWRAC